MSQFETDLLRWSRHAKSINAGVCIVLITSLFSLLLVVSGCGSSAPRQAAQAVNIRPISWGVISTQQPDTVKIVSEVGYCQGDPKPTIRRIRSRYNGKKVYITAEVARPRKKPSSKQGALCLGRVLPIYKTIKLSRTLQGSILYDASRNPPAVRWPDSSEYVK